MTQSWNQFKENNKLKYTKMETKNESVTREFDDEQYKLEEGDEEGDTDLQTMERANELSRQYEEIKDRTVDSDTVLGKLTKIDTSPGNNNIILTVDLPAESSNEQFRFKKPKVWSNDYKFVRWIQMYDYDADSFPNMIEDHCRVKVKQVNSGEYELIIPQRNRVKVSSKLDSYKETYLDNTNPEYYLTSYMAISWFMLSILFASTVIVSPLNALPTFGVLIAALIGILGFGYMEETIKE